ncbi:MAG: HEAT repeat domain-containing protein [Bacteroidales bacterium]
MVAITIIILVLTACEKSPDLDTIKSICLVVEQNHPTVDDKDFSLPIEPHLRETLEEMGLEVRDQGQPCDAIFTVSLEVETKKSYFPGREKECYWGSEATGEAALEVEGFSTIIEPLHGWHSETVLTYCYGSTNKFIYEETLPNVVLDALINVWGERAIIALLKTGLETGIAFELEYFLRDMFAKHLLSENDVVPALLHAFEYINDTVRMKAAEALAFATQGKGPTVDNVTRIIKRTDGILELLLDMAQNENLPETRECAVRLIGQIAIEPELAIPVLISLLDEENVDLRLYAMYALEEYGPEAAEAIPVLEEMLEDESERIQRGSEGALQEIRQ